MNAARQISRRFGRTTGARTRSAADYSITATLSVVPDPLETRMDLRFDGDIVAGPYQIVLRRMNTDGKSYALARLKVQVV